MAAVAVARVRRAKGYAFQPVVAKFFCGSEAALFGAAAAAAGAEVEEVQLAQERQVHREGDEGFVAVEGIVGWLIGPQLRHVRRSDLMALRSRCSIFRPLPDLGAGRVLLEGYLPWLSLT